MKKSTLEKKILIIIKKKYIYVQHHKWPHCVQKGKGSSCVNKNLKPKETKICPSRKPDCLMCTSNHPIPSTLLITWIWPTGVPGWEGLNSSKRKKIYIYTSVHVDMSRN